MSFIGAAAIIGGGMMAGGVIGGLTNKGAKGISYNAPSYYQDPNYAVSQNSLMPFASSLMSGKGLPDAYAGLITPNSPQFQQMLQRTTGNVLGATQDAMAGQGIGDSGVAMSAAAGAVGNATSQLTYQDFVNSQANQMNLMGMGSGIMENVGSMALNAQQEQNQFNLSNASYGMQADEFNANLQQQQSDNRAKTWQGLTEAGGNIMGMGMMGGFGGGASAGGMSGATGGVNAGWMAQPSLNQMGPWSFQQGGGFAMAPNYAE
jgi:hypothetical protein